ncbi:hypothetical protein [Sphingobacterium sp. SYP-B4668]|uniref:hypothetical protein n=1 Tax=Sphingobacterium sp. SYP-B4668 TaxID=2996035 RepID=UPI0022DD3C9E|nr:hypothetical protein [Sphingobacterium sp. SYP-B4668]
MKLGKYYHQNREKTDQLSDWEWKIALAKCKEHLKWRMKQKTLSGAHSSSNLGMDAVDHYLGIAFEKILNGEWEWKEEYSLGQQMIRIADSTISKSIQKTKTKKSEALQVSYLDVEQHFYDLAEPPDDEETEAFSKKIKSIEEAVIGDIQLELLVEALKEGKKRSEIAELLELEVRQFDKLREKLLRKVKEHSAKKE